MERLQQIPDHCMRAIFLAMCTEPSFQRRALNHLDNIEKLQDGLSHGGFAAGSRDISISYRGGANDYGSGDVHGSYNSTGQAIAPKNVTKRKAPDDDMPIRVCVQCLQPFSEGLNTPQSCSFHYGDLEVDEGSDFWADHDEDTGGDIDTPEMREVYPQGFRWLCCRRLGDGEGCHHGHHQSANGRRGRYYANGTVPLLLPTDTAAGDGANPGASLGAVAAEELKSKRMKLTPDIAVANSNSHGSWHDTVLDDTPMYH